MRYAILSDIHANEAALRQVLRDAEEAGAERIVCLGDVVGYGPQPAEALALLRSEAAVTVIGNHDAAVAGLRGTDDFIGLAARAIGRHREELKADDRAWLRSLPQTAAFGEARAVHGDFTDPAQFNYVGDNAAAARNFAATDAPLLFVGHTHVPEIFLTGQSGAVYRIEPQDFILEEGKRYIVNPGAVGYPRESDGVCCSSYVLYDSVARTVAFHFLPFDVSSLLQRHAESRHRRLLGLAAAVSLLALAAAGLCLWPFASGREERWIVLQEKRLDLERDWKTVSANLRIEKEDPVRLRVEFVTASGESVGKKFEREVRASSGSGIRIPAGAAAARFTLLRESTAHPRILSFAPAPR